MKGKLEKTLDFFVGLVAERNGDKVWRASVGRVSWWVAFIPSLYIWGQTNGDIQPHHQMILLALAGYNLGKKVVDIKKNNENS